MVVPNSDYLEAAEQRIRSDVLACAPGAVAATKKLIREVTELSTRQKISFAAENFMECLKSDEGIEGVESFLAKRKPNWHQGN